MRALLPLRQSNSEYKILKTPLPRSRPRTSSTTHRQPDRKTLSPNLPISQFQSRTQHPPGSSLPNSPTRPCLALPSSPQPSPPRHRAQNSRKLANSSAPTPCGTMQMLRHGGTTGPCSATLASPGGLLYGGASYHPNPAQAAQKKGWGRDLAYMIGGRG